MKYNRFYDVIKNFVDQIKNGSAKSQLVPTDVISP